MNALLDALRQSASLDTPQDQGLGHSIAEFGASLLPGVGQAMAARDFERARRAGDKTDMLLSAASFIPGGRVLKKGKEMVDVLRGKKIVPEEASQIFAGRGAANAPHMKLDAAEYGLQQGTLHPEQAWQKYGAYMGNEPTAPMKWEIPDQTALINLAKYIKGNKGQFSGTLEEFLGHPELYANYPQLKGVRLNVNLDPKFKGAAEGRYSAGENALGPYQVMDVAGGNYKEILSTILHEAQHGVQRHEKGFSQGANFDAVLELLRKKHPNRSESDLRANANEIYMRNIGEVEARAVEERLNSSSAHNRAVHPSLSMDRPHHQRLFETPAVYGYGR